MMGRAAATAALILVALGPACADDDDAGASPSEPGGAGSSEAGSAAPLVAAFSFAPDIDVVGPTHCQLVSIAFTDESTGGPEDWRWEFSDGSTSDEEDPVVTAEVTEATLTVTRGDDEDSTTEPVTFPVC